MLEAIVRVKELGLDFDHAEHKILYDAAKDIVGVDGIVCEVGLRQGGGMGIMILGCIDTENTNRPFIAIDPYGNLMYNAQEGLNVRYDYTNDMKYETLIALCKVSLQNNLYFDLICLEDTTFFSKYESGIPIYNLHTTVVNTYALVHLDGPHALKDVLTEVEFFMDRIANDGYIVLDDVKYYDLSKIEPLLINNSFKLVANDGKKASYKKVNKDEILNNNTVSE